MNKRIFSLLLVTGAVLAMLSGCESKEDNGSTTTTADATTTVVTTASSADDTTTTVLNVADKDTTSTETPTTESTESTRKTVTTRSKASTVNASDLFPVKVTGTAKQRAQAINNKLAGSKQKIASEKYTVLPYNNEYTFTHHPGLAYFNGKWYASFTQSVKDEDAPGQRVVVCSSSDFKNWSDPVVVGPCVENTLVPGTQSANVPSPMYVMNGRLYITYAARNYGKHKFDKNNNFLANADVDGIDQGYITWTEDGVNWKTPQKFDGVVANDSLRQTVTGRWFAIHGKRAAFSDDKNPNGLYWETSGLSAQQMTDATNRNDGNIHTESSWYQTKDHVLHVMIRSETGYLWHYESYDNGNTWSDMHPTSFTSASSMWKFGELPDGRIYGVGSSTYNTRYPLELWVSDDGVNFDTCYILRDEKTNQISAGYAKGGDFGYPSVVVRDGYLHVLYSRHKEFMEVTRVKLSDIK